MLAITGAARAIGAGDIADEPAPQAAERTKQRTPFRLSPEQIFWLAGILIYGAAAINFAYGHWLSQTSRDIWQHLAALRELLVDPINPANPFVPNDDGSRHFHPYWVSIALVGRVFGWNAWQALAFAGFVTAGVLLAGIWTFARAFYRSAWGPLALLAAMVLGWSLPVSHTGYHSVETLIEGLAYPATLLVGLSLILWALVIRALERPKLALLVFALSAFMFATHQLGAGIGFVVAGAFLLLWPNGSLKARAAVAAAMAAGILVAEGWPYHSPFEAILRTGNAKWTGGIPFYTPYHLIVAGVPSLIGLWGLAHRRYRRGGLAITASFLFFAGIFAGGAFGMPIGTRFLMPAVLMLHIGLGALLVILAERWPRMDDAWKLAVFTIAALCVQLHAITAFVNLRAEGMIERHLGNSYAAASELTRDIPDQEPVGAYDVAAWPIVATGQRVVSVPWPEPGITDLRLRQRTAERLFDPTLTREERLRLARAWGVRRLIMDRRGPLRRRTPPRLIETLTQQSVARHDDRMFIRFDLE